MKKNIFLIIGLLMVVAGVAIAYFAKFELADMTGFALTMFGAYLLGFGGFSKETMTTVITMVFGLVGIIAGLIIAAIQSKNAKQIE